MWRKVALRACAGKGWGMTTGEFLELSEAEAAEYGLAALAVWWDARGRWEAAHEAAQKASGRDGDWVHAYLHRVQGDELNAGYWYARAGRGRPAPGTSLEAERTAILAELLK